MADSAHPDVSDDAEQVYAAPAEALRAARATMSSPTATRADRVQALWVLGRTAYYSNRMSDAVRLLRDALPLVDDPELLTELLLTLAPALSKEGHPDEALQILQDPALELEPKFAGQLRNQRGIILTELNRLPEALAQTEEALTLLHEAGDVHHEARALVNLGAIASVMGRLDDAERWNADARDLAISTGQDVVASAIEGNLGYIESRRGNFATALDWYARARASFETFEEVGLLEAVLEVDHARTLLDVGLAADAAEASVRATESSTAGGNQMLETQSRLLLAEALIRLGEHRAADEQIRRGAELARRLGQAAYELRAAYLAFELEAASSSAAPVSSMTVGVDIEQFLAAGWVREAYEAALQRAVHMRADDPDAARDILLAADQRTEGLDVDPVVRAFGSLLLADCADDPGAVDAAFDAALAAIAEQRELVGSAEMRATIARRVGPVRDIALGAALRMDRPAATALEVLERARSVREAPSGRARPTAIDTEKLARLRDARVALEEAKFAGTEVRAADARVRALERETLARRRVMLAERSAPPTADQPASEPLPPDTAYVTFALHRRHLIGVVHARGATKVARLGSVSEVLSLIRTQRTALRHLADERRQQSTKDLQRLVDASGQLDAALIAPLDVGWADRLVLTPAIALRGLAWAALPSRRGRPATLTPTLGAWTNDAERIRVGRVAFLGGPGLANVDELEAISRVWQQPDAVVLRASCGEAAAALRRADLVHIAAHGSFRTDNPFFSSLVFADGQLSVLELTELETVPSVVVLASCDAGAAAAASTTEDPLTADTATELRHLGARLVIAPLVSVNDAAAADFSRCLHERLARGASVDDAMIAVRHTLSDDGEPTRVAAAQAFHVFGSRATRDPLDLSSRR